MLPLAVGVHHADRAVELQQMFGDARHRLPAGIVRPRPERDRATREGAEIGPLDRFRPLAPGEGRSTAEIVLRSDQGGLAFDQQDGRLDFQRIEPEQRDRP